MNWRCCVDRQNADMLAERSYLLAIQLTLFVSLTAAYFLHPSHLQLKRKFGQYAIPTKPNKLIE